MDIRVCLVVAIVAAMAGSAQAVPAPGAMLLGMMGVALKGLARRITGGNRKE